MQEAHFCAYLFNPNTKTRILYMHIFLYIHMMIIENNNACRVVENND